jgi:hypothetical protein|eukprot:evm.model.NODE_1239_length_22662_cov_34.288322.3
MNASEAEREEEGLKEEEEEGCWIVSKIPERVLGAGDGLGIGVEEEEEARNDEDGCLRVSSRPMTAVDTGSCGPPPGASEEEGEGAREEGGGCTVSKSRMMV